MHERMFAGVCCGCWCQGHSGRLSYLNFNQPQLHAGAYKHVQAAVAANLQGKDIGGPTILPSSFVGSDRYMRHLYQVSFG